MTDMTVANEIARQIGSRAFFMMGTKQKLGDQNSLSFDVKGSRWKWVKILLEPNDTYTIFFRKINRKNELIEEKVEDVYCDSLHDVIERHTKLYLSFSGRLT